MKLLDRVSRNEYWHNILKFLKLVFWLEFRFSFMNICTPKLGRDPKFDYLSIYMLKYEIKVSFVLLQTK